MGFLINNKNQSVVTREISGVNVGTIVEFPKGTTIPSSFLDANGSLYDPLVWVDLYKFLGTNKLPNAYAGEARVGDVKWFQNRNSLPYGWVAADGLTIIPFSDFPDVKAAMDAGRLVTVTESVYTSDSSKRASWSNATTGFRTPDYNGKSAGSLGSLFLRGDGGVAAPVGTIQGDAIRNITGSISFHGSQSDGSGGTTVSALGGVFRGGITQRNYTPGSMNPDATSLSSAEFDTSKVVPTSTENRPLNTAGCWAVCLIDPNIKAIKAGGFVDNDGLLSAVGVLKQVSDIRDDLNSVSYVEKTVTLAYGTWKIKFIKNGRTVVCSVQTTADVPANVSIPSGADLISYPSGFEPIPECEYNEFNLNWTNQGKILSRVVLAPTTLKLYDVNTTGVPSTAWYRGSTTWISKV